MASATTPSVTKRYRISFQIRDGDNEYYKDTIMDSDHEPTEEEQVGEVFLQYGVTDYVAYSENVAKKLKAAAWKQWQEDGYLELGRDYRIIQDIGIEPETERLDRELATAGQNLFDQINVYLFDQEISDQELPKEMTDAFDSWTAVMNKAEGLAQPPLE